MSIVASFHCLLILVCLVNPTVRPSVCLTNSDVELRAAHTAGQTQAGLDINAGTIGNMWDLGIRESYKSKLQVGGWIDR